MNRSKTSLNIKMNQGYGKKLFMVEEKLSLPNS